MSGRSKPQGGGGRSEGRREGPDPSKYLRNRSVDTSLGPPSTSEKVITRQPKATNVALRSRHLETRSGDAGDDDLDPSEWDIVDEVESPKDPITEKARRTDSTVSTDSNTALDEALTESKELREKHEKVLRKLSEQEKKSKRLQEQLAEKKEEVVQLRAELTESRGPSSGLSSGSYQTPLSSFSEGTELEQPTVEGRNGSVMMRLQKENESKDGEIVKLKKDIIQLKRRLDHAGELEEQTTRLATEVSVHEQEKIELQKQIEKLQHQAEPQQPLHDEADVHALRRGGDILKQKNADLHRQLEVTTRQYEKQYSEAIHENAQLRQKLTAVEKQLHSGPLTHIDDADTDEMPKLKEALQERDSRIQHLQEQLESYRKTATEFSALQEHSKEQSKRVMKLRSHVDAAKIGETEHADFEKDLMQSLHSLQDQYDKLLKDYQAVSRDRGFMVESMTALKKRNEQLVSELQQCKAEMGKLKQQEESARLQWESMRDNHRALHQKNQELLTEKQKLEAENVRFIDNVKKISNLGNENADLQRRIIALRKEREDIWNELQAAKAESQLYKEDFDHEREDRAKAHAQIDDIRTELTKQLEETRRELELHKERLSDVEAVNQRKAGELKSALEEALASRQEVQAKASQVKQFKKQVDSLKLHVAEAEKQNINLVQAMETVRTDLVKHKGKAEKVQKKKEKAPPSASSPVAPPPPGWESRVADLEQLNEELRNETDRLRQENEAYCDKVQNLQEMCDSQKGLVDPQASHGFSAESKAGAKIQQQPHPPPVAGYGQDQELIRKQLQQGFQQQPHTEHQTAGASGLTPGPSSLPEAMYHQAPVPRAKIQIRQPDSNPHVSKSSEVAPHYQPNPAISPTSQPYHNWPPDSRAGDVRLQQPEVRALTDPQALAQHRSAEGQFHASRSATDYSPPQNVAKQPPIPPTLQRQSSVPGSSAHGQQQQSSYVPEPNIMQHITTDIHAVAGNVVSQVAEERARQPTMQHVPYDPNLVCVYCNKQFRIGEIQKYKHHVETCNGSEGTQV